MISALVCYVSVFGVDLLIAHLAVVGNIEVLSMCTLDVVLHCMQFGAALSTEEANVPTASVASDKLLQLVIPL